MDKKYTDIWKLAEDIVTAIETMQEADRKMGFCQYNLIPSGYEDSIDDLKQHAEDIRDFYFEGEPDGEGGEVAVGSPVEWIREPSEPSERTVSEFLDDNELHQVMNIVGAALDRAKAMGNIKGDTDNLVLSIMAHIPED